MVEPIQGEAGVIAPPLIITKKEIGWAIKNSFSFKLR